MKISIIIPIYNKGKYLNKIFNQIMGQTFSDFECILIDDGSTDDSSNICDEFEKSDKRFRVLHVENGGVSKARNIGIDNAKGDYITFIDSDDEIHPKYLENLFKCIYESNVDIVIGTSVKIWDDNQKTELIETPYLGIENIEVILSEFCEHQYKNGIYGYCWNKLIKKNKLENIRFNQNIKLAEDLDFYLDLYPKINKIYFDKMPYYYYRQDAINSSMQKEDWEYDYFTQLKIQLKMYNMIVKANQMNELNKLLSVNRIYDYVYFTIFYAPKDRIFEYIYKIRRINLPQYHFKIQGVWQKHIVLKLFMFKMDYFLKLFIKIYRKMKGFNY